MLWSVKADPNLTVLRQRMTEPPPVDPARMRAHPGHEWLVVLSGTAILMLGHRRFRVETNQAAEFPTMLPHSIGTETGPCEILGIFDRDARRSHQAGAGNDEPA
jgi:mannose-6-phosphate isomerase-like protein (cupin superfamily)